MTIDDLLTFFAGWCSSGAVYYAMEQWEMSAWQKHGSFWRSWGIRCRICGK